MIKIVSPLNPLYQRSDVYQRSDKKMKQSKSVAVQFMPLELQTPGGGGDYWRMPTEPIVSYAIDNKIIRRHVAKQAGNGTIKERWSEDDVKITIRGVLIGKEGKYPHEDVKMLHDICGQKTAIGIRQEQLTKLGVNYIVVETLDLPFSKGETNQNFTITAVSDDDYSLTKTESKTK